MESEGTCRIFLRVLLIALHPILVCELKELLDGLFKLFTVLQPPLPPLIQSISELEPGQSAICCSEGPLIRNGEGFSLRDGGDFPDDAIVIEQLGHQTFQLVLRLDPLLVLVEFGAEDLLDHVLLPLVEDLLAVAATELVLVLLLLCGDRDSNVGPLLVEVLPFKLELALSLLVELPELSNIAVQVLLALGESGLACMR